MGAKNVMSDIPRLVDKTRFFPFSLVFLLHNTDFKNQFFNFLFVWLDPGSATVPDTTLKTQSTRNLMNFISA